jgi:hypothetical protein
MLSGQMTPEQAQDLKSELGAISRQALALTAGLDAAPLMRRPTSGGWSVAQNLQHLVLTADAMLPLAEAAISALERGGSKAGGPSGLGFVGWLLVKTLEPPARMKTRTTKPFEPVSVDDPLALIGGLQEANAKLDALITRATGLATSTLKVVSPFNHMARYNVYAALRIMLAHTRRHLWQAEQATARS